jgi:hypothetical protein
MRAQEFIAEGIWERHQSIPELERAIENLIMGYNGGLNLTDKGRAQLLLSINKGKRILAKKKQQQGVSEEQLDELSFLGSECTKDCSGHRAGYEWSKRKGLRQANSWSPSFNKGAGLAVAGK